MDARDFLDEVFLDGEVEAARRRRHLPAVHGVDHRQAQRTEDAHHVGIDDRQAQHAFKALAAQVDRPWLWQVLGQLRGNHRPRRAAGVVEDQPGGELDRLRRQLRIDPALEAVRGIGMQAQPARAPDDRGRREMCRLQEHVAGRIGHAGVVAAHHPGQRHRAPGIGDHQEVRIQRHVAPVEKGQRLATAGMTHAHRALQQVTVERVHRLPQFEHHVLGDVDQEAQRADPAATQPLGHPHRRSRAGFDALDHPTEIARCVGTGVERDIEPRIARRGHRRDRVRGDAAAERGGDIEGDAAHAEAVGAVGGELELERRIRQAKVVRKRRADRRIAGQFQQARGIAVEPEFLCRAQHAVGLDAAQRRRPDGEFAHAGTDHRQRCNQSGTRVGRATDDLQRRTGAGIDAAHLQAVGLGVFFAGDDACDDDAVEAFAQHRGVLDLEPDGSQGGSEFLAAGVGVHMLAEPVLGKFHAEIPWIVIRRTA